LGLYSLDVLASLRQRTGIEYGRSATGSLKIFRDHASLDRAAAAAARLASAGLHFRRLTPDEAVVLEPALAPIEEKLAGAIHYQGDETGDAYRFCEGLTACARQQDVEFRFATEVSALEVRSGQVVAVRSPQGRFVADHYVVTAASYSTPLLRGGGIQLPVRPAKGYSITFDAPPGQPPLSIPLIDDQLHAAVVPLQGAIRAAGTAEFAGFDLSLNHERVRNLVSLAQGMLPHAGLDPAAARPWCGLRPMSADGVPIIGPTPISNLWVNTGHGHLGWTMAAGSGRFLADLITGASPAIEPGHYSLRRFS
jgi:D-amino-acid dehydrogenase